MIPDTEHSRSIAPTGPVEKVADGFAFTEGPADDGQGGFFFTDIPKTSIHHVDENGKLTLWTDQSKHANGLMVRDGRLYACEMDGQVVSYAVAGGDRKLIAGKYQGKRFNACNDLDLDSKGGVYFTDPLYRAPQPLPQGIQAAYYVTSKGEVTRLTKAIPAPNGIALSPDEKRLYVAPTQQSTMLVYDVDAPGKVSGGRKFCQLTQVPGGRNQGSDGIAVDVRGNVYFTTAVGVEVVSPAGQSLAIIDFPKQPANVTFVGRDKKTMVVTARDTVYKVPMPIAGK
ncbi:MAG: SMP-30/gluconolactonase/LRE family protein [Planctomycetota bacterium]